MEAQSEWLDQSADIARPKGKLSTLYFRFSFSKIVRMQLGKFNINSYQISSPKSKLYYLLYYLLCYYIILYYIISLSSLYYLLILIPYKLHIT